MSTAPDDAPTAAPAPTPAEPTPIWASEVPQPAPSGAAPEPAPAPRRSSRLKLGIVAGVSAVIVIGGGVAVAQAANDGGAGQSSGGPGGGQGRPGGGQGRPGGGQAGGAPGAQNGQNQQGFPGGGFARGGGGGMNVLGGALHGDFVVRSGNGQYVTERLQSGTVTAVSATAITAKSEDGFSTTFVVGADTKVANGASKISDVKTGDTVTVVGTVAGDTATATEITDTALMRQGNGGGGQRPNNSVSPRPARTA